MVRRASPVRTCVGCRGRAQASELLRIVATVREDDLIVLTPDPARTLPGRGAHVHPDSACLALAERRRAFGRALRVSGVIDAGPLRARLVVSDSESPTVGPGCPTRPQGRTTNMSTR